VSGPPLAAGAAGDPAADQAQPGATGGTGAQSGPGASQRQRDPAAAPPRSTTAQAQPGAQVPPRSTTAQAQPGAQVPPQSTAVPGQPQPAAAQPPRPHVLRRTRIGGVWVGLAAAIVVLLLLLIFILENGHRADIAFFGAHASLPLGVALLLAAVAGALIVIIPGTGRIIQLRSTARRHRRMDAAATSAAPASATPPRAASP